MAIQGELRTMGLGDLLRWAANKRQTGVLELERNKIGKRIVFEEGRVVACSSDDPPSRYGQFLIAQGRITPHQLRKALARQRTENHNLGSILESMGLMSPADNDEMIAAKAQEDIYSLFDWPDAHFRFDEDPSQNRWGIKVELTADDILERGLQRHHELDEIRRVFLGSDLQLRRTEKSVPAGISRGVMARRILRLVDGERTIAEILLHAHAGEYLVVKFLFSLHQRGIVRVDGRRRLDRGVLTILDDSAGGSAMPALAEETRRDLPPRDADVTPPQDLNAVISRAQRLLDEGKIDDALDLLNGCYRDRPGDDYVKQLILRAESAYLEVVCRTRLAPSLVPELALPRDELPESELQPNELYLISTIDGEVDVQSLIWTAPLREIEILRTLDSLRRRGLIDLRHAAPVPSEE
jgi:hypothetical protein